MVLSILFSDETDVFVHGLSIDPTGFSGAPVAQESFVLYMVKSKSCGRKTQWTVVPPWSVNGVFSQQQRDRVDCNGEGQTKAWRLVRDYQKHAVNEIGNVGMCSVLR